ncbi:MAG: DUF456 domain-containing protein [Chloroflexota bacterium]|nr:MAG: DUF456 domain-containing protein [Chloroflexota bacterium]
MPPTIFTNPAANLTLLLILVGLIGTVIPVVPGALLIWFGILVWAVGEKFQRIDVFTLIVLGILALAATFSEYWLRPLVQTRAGFGWKQILAAIAGGIVGGILLSEIPVLGTLFGAAIGSVIGTSALTYWERKNFGEAVRAGKAYLVGCALSSFVEVLIALLMLAIFVWRAFL